MARQPQRPEWQRVVFRKREAVVRLLPGLEMGDLLDHDEEDAASLVASASAPVVLLLLGLGPQVGGSYAALCRLLDDVGVAWQEEGRVHCLQLHQGSPYALARLAPRDALSVFTKAQGRPAAMGKVYVDVVRPSSSWIPPRIEAKAPPGALVELDFVDDRLGAALVAMMAEAQRDEPDAWQVLKRRRVRHYGRRFDYATNRAAVDDGNADAALAMPPLLRELTAAVEALVARTWRPLADDGLGAFAVDQVTVNEYEPGAGIPPHADTHGAFREPLLSLSLASDVVMDFARPDSGETGAVRLPPRSLLLLTADARYHWTHAIKSRRVDPPLAPLERIGTDRTTRLSFTFRQTTPASFRCPCGGSPLCA